VLEIKFYNVFLCGTDGAGGCDYSQACMHTSLLISKKNSVPEHADYCCSAATTSIILELHALGANSDDTD
jgi:hypothetical protein